MSKRRAATRAKPARKEHPKAPAVRGVARAGPPGPPAPPPPLHRDRWAWLSVLGVLPIVIHAWGAPLGEAVAEDFDFLHRVMFSKTHTLLDGGGSSSFWRPVAHQLYYETFAGLILHHPGLLSTLHVLMLALASLLLYRSFRRAHSGPVAMVVATFPLLSESTRTVISWPSHFVELGVWMFTAIAVHETAARRLWSSLLALLAALLCKEVAVVAVLLLPWMPELGPRGTKSRLRWSAAMLALTGAWAVVYLSIRHHAHLVLPHQLETRADVIATPVLARLWWAAANSVRALFSLPAAETAWGKPVLIVAGLLMGLALLIVLARARGAWAARLLHDRAMQLAAWGLAWFVAASGTLVPIYPIWAPNRSGFGSLGFGALAAALTAAVHPALLSGLVALRLAAFALSPGPPAIIVDEVPKQGAFMDFERLVRLQRLMRYTRGMLETMHPTLPHGARIGQHYLPRLSEYAFGGSKSLQVWYGDSTLRMVRYSEFVADQKQPMVVIAEYQPHHLPQMAPVNPRAMSTFLGALSTMNTQAFEEGLAALARAESLQTDTTARVFRGEIWGSRATCLVFLHRPAETEMWANRGMELWPENVYAEFALACLAYRRGALEMALARFERVLRLSPNYSSALEMRRRVLEAMAERNRARPPVRP
jgi:hypothetical protein